MIIGVPIFTELAEIVISVVVGSAVAKGVLDTVMSLIREKAGSVVNRSANAGPRRVDRELEDAIQKLDKLLSENEKIIMDTQNLRVQLERIKDVSADSLEKNVG